ncbi:hypothetical protein BC332_14777 [Capsicum chinense]|nr:hypothetical protein BC332_14777 [Capsicum chinense]
MIMLITWKKILDVKLIRICEICGTNALNIAGELTNEANNAAVATLAASAAPVAFSETRSFWHGRRVMNFLLASLVFAFVISWLFHFNILPYLLLKIVLAATTRSLLFGFSMTVILPQLRLHPGL